jgi:hypothetical protein
MIQVQAAAAEPPALDAGQSISSESSGGRSSTLPTPRVANGSRVGFLSGLVTTDSGMIALIDLANLLSIQINDEATMKPAMSA